MVLLLNFLLGKRLEVLIQNAIQNNMEWFKNEIRNKFLNSNVNEKDSEQIYMELNANLIQNIVSDITKFVRGNPGTISARYQLALMSPSISGYDFHGEDMSLGMLYCVLYYAHTNKKAKLVTASKQNHILYAYIQKALHELDEEKVCG